MLGTPSGFSKLEFVIKDVPPGISSEFWISIFSHETTVVHSLCTVYVYVKKPRPNDEHIFSRKTREFKVKFAKKSFLQEFFIPLNLRFNGLKINWPMRNLCQRNVWSILEYFCNRVMTISVTFIHPRGRQRTKAAFI